jgi:hypothetical protein
VRSELLGAARGSTTPVEPSGAQSTTWRQSPPPLEASSHPCTGVPQCEISGAHVASHSPPSGKVCPGTLSQTAQVTLMDFPLVALVPVVTVGPHT